MKSGSWSGIVGRFGMVRAALPITRHHYALNENALRQKAGLPIGVPLDA